MLEARRRVKEEESAGRGENVDVVGEVENAGERVGIRGFAGDFHAYIEKVGVCGEWDRGLGEMYGDVWGTWWVLVGEGKVKVG